MLSHFALGAALLCATLFGGMLATHEVGRRVRLRQIALGGPSEVRGAGVVEGSVFALIGLLLAFTFSEATSRFDNRRQMIVEEANAIGTAYLRLEMLSEPARNELRVGFRDYVDSRLRTYRALPDVVAAQAELARSAELQQKIWSQGVAATNGLQPPAAMLLLPALNAMFDIANTRTALAHMHPPVVIYALLFALCLLAGFLAGYAMGTTERNWIHTVMFGVTLASAIYVVIDLEFPRFGLIRIDAFDRVLVDVRQSMR